MRNRFSVFGFGRPGEVELPAPRPIGGLINGSIGYIRILKNASTSLEPLFQDHGFAPMFEASDIALAVIREPVTRWISSACTFHTRYAGLFDTDGNYITPEWESFVDVILSDLHDEGIMPVYDEHMIPQRYFYRPLQPTHLIAMDQKFSTRLASFLGDFDQPLQYGELQRLNVSPPEKVAYLEKTMTAEDRQLIEDCNPLEAQLYQSARSGSSYVPYDDS